ncbi:ras family-domain-containing protein [Aspergillus pseudotamarii]|uniref:Ras family-domain-containing protein n=1 Tax=Aspergillus pseudotamarii TaxID=132259 RepID=A0A5N6T484_ASPPS|nr:ras family-domain-containing protein [Aspergillus pseudotamarii]KAE8141126.1 ras family-domain-containing protein [Aspergillus pseudotamarii]
MPDNVKVVVVGDEGVGKSALILRLCFDHFSNTHEATADDSIRKSTVVDGKECELDIIDTAGREQYATLIEEWIRQGEVFVLVFDVASQESFTHVRKYYDQVRKIKEVVDDHSINPPATYPGPPYFAPLILVGNKSDLQHERTVSESEGMGLAKELCGEYVEASARDNVNVEAAFNQAVRKIRARRYEADHSLFSHADGAATTTKRYRPFHRRHPSGCHCVIL